ncbi:MAG: metal ABC transporter substrate-binding protein [Marinagarivorans sp.]|nr:metal ABC transporter substrate-binding protein [Marinagarivorans sp.]
MYKTFYLLVLMALTAMVAGCGAGDQSAPVKPNVVVSIKPLALMAQDLAGEDFTVHTLGSGSSDPHAQAMTITDRAVLARADLVVWLGPNFERFLAKSMSSAKQAQLQLGLEAGMQWPGDAGADLHLWLNPNNIAVAYRALAQQLVLIKPAAADVIAARLTAQLAATAQAQAHIELQLAPFKQEPFAVSHDGFGHFVQAFGLNQRAAATRLPEEQLSVRRMAELNHMLKNAKCLLVEPHDHHGHKLANSISLPEVTVDVLGRDESIHSLPLLLQSVAASLVECFTAPSVVNHAVDHHDHD